MTGRLPIAFLAALALHGGAGIWLSSLMTPPEAVPFVEAAPQLEMELIAPPEPVAATPASTAPSPAPVPDRTPPEPAPEALTPEPVTPQEPEPAPPELNQSPSPEPPPPPKPQPKPEPVRKNPEKRPAPSKAAVRPRPADPSASGSVPPPRGSGGGSPGGTAGGRGKPAGTNSGPVCVSRPAPAYPPALLERQIGGTVVVEADIDSNGRVTGTSLAASSGQAALDRSALAGVRRWKFRPAQKAGSPVTSRARVNVVFRPR